MPQNYATCECGPAHTSDPGLGRLFDPFCFEIGDVFAIEESISTPIQHILADSKISMLKGPEKHLSSASLRSLCTQEHATTKSPRPCILMAPVRSRVPIALQEVTGASVCLMGTLEGTPIEELPLVLRFFLLMVYPSLYDGIPHIHSLPEWSLGAKEPHYRQCIIAWRFKTTRNLLSRWLMPTSKEVASLGEAASGISQMPAPCTGSRKEPVVFGDRAMEILQDRCVDLRSQWIKMCKEDPLSSAACAKEYREWSSRKPKALSRTANDRASQVSAVPSRAPPSRGSVLNMSIYEDEVSDLFTAPWKAPPRPGRNTSAEASRLNDKQLPKPPSWNPFNKTRLTAPALAEGFYLIHYERDEATQDLWKQPEYLNPNQRQPILRTCRSIIAAIG
ncbi:hypothetical protein OH77DRAFT_1514285 [Trametes cingulata]|nr:hypothetical protein OH77DRAFT_1514285 [Trametes cingulata]